MGNREKDELASLLDSFQDDDTMERKMDNFARQKEHKSRVERTQDRVQPQPKAPVESQGETVVFNKVNVEQEEEDSQGTVMMDDAEIQSLLDENKGPSLRVEKEQRVASPKSPRRKKAPKNDAKKVGAVVACIVGALIVASLLFVGIKAVLGGFGDSEKKQEETFDRIVAFLDEEDLELSRVRQFKELYDKLPEEMREEIDDEIYTITRGECSNFDELLDKAKSEKRKEDQDKKDQKNENMKIAERKAEIKDEINRLKKKLSELSKKPDNSRELARAEKELNAAVKKQNDAQASVNEIQNKINAVNADIVSVSQEREELLSKPSSEATEEEKARANELWNQYVELNNNTLPNLQTELASAQAVLDERLGVAAEAQAEYDAIQAEANANNNDEEKAQIQAQIAELEQELRDLDK